MEIVSTRTVSIPGTPIPGFPEATSRDPGYLQIGIRAKELITIMKTLIALTLAGCAIAAVPVSAQQRGATTSNVSVASPLGISAVSDAREINMPAIPGGSVGFEANPAFFAGGQLCVSGLNENWAIRRDGTLDTRDPARRMSCAPIDAQGRATVANPFGPRAVPVIIAADGHIYWAGRDRLTGLSGS